jgi:hypoxanthine phosphoribosyltransferase
MRDDIDRVLIDGDRLAARVRDLAQAVTKDHSPPAVPGEAEVTIIPILTGAFVFAADLIRGIPLPIKINLVTVSSYPGQSVKSQGTSVLNRQLQDVAGRHVVLVDDILDSGQTLATVVPIVRDLGAASVKTCVLLRKTLPTPPAIEADYVGFEIPDEFVVGYGLDYDSVYRNLPDICVLKRSVFAQDAPDTDAPSGTLLR